MTGPPLVLVAHGSRSDAADEVVQQIAASAAVQVAVEVRIGYLDVRRPAVAEVAAGLDRTVVAAPLGAHPDVVATVAERYRAAAGGTIVAA